MASSARVRGVLLMDIGNSAIKACRRSSEGSLRAEGSWPSSQPPDFSSLLNGQRDGAVMASVIPSLSQAVRDAALRGGIDVIEVTPASASCAGISGMYSTMGPDRVADLIALASSYALPAVCVDAGTAITFDVMAEGRIYQGGLITPGPALMATALSEGTALLPCPPETWEDFSLATDTRAAVATGISWGSIAMTEGILRLLHSHGVRWRTLVVTGGLAQRMSRHLAWDHVIDGNLTFKGLNIVWESAHVGTHPR